MAAAEDGFDAVVMVRQSEWNALRAEVEELRDTVALLVKLSMETAERIDPLESTLRKHSLLD